jgi:hypothetical protein
MDIAAWLRGLDLGQYEAAFRANDIDAAILPELTTEDLISIGVTSVGHRRKLLAAIAALRAIEASLPAPPRGAALPPFPRPPRLQREGPGRKQSGGS